MQLGMVGLGRMGANMVRRLMRGGHECAIFDVNPDNVKSLAREGARVAVCGRTQETMDKALEEIRAAGGQATGVAADITDADPIDLATGVARQQVVV